MGTTNKLYQTIFIYGLCATLSSFVPGRAFATDPATHTSTSTATTLSTGASGQGDAQKNAADNKQKGSGLTKIMGLMQAGIGGFMIYDGMKQLPVNHSAGVMEMLMGAMTLMQAALSMQASNQMGKDASAGYNHNFDLQNPLPTDPNYKVPGGEPTGSSVSIDPSSLHTGQVGMAMDKFEKASGLSRDDLANALNSGMSPADFIRSKLGNNPDVNKAFDQGAATLASNPNAADGVLAKYGLDPNKESTGASYADGGGASTSGGFENKSSVDDFLNSLNKPQEEANAKGGFKNISPEVRKSLEKNGITDKSIFQMVSSQYDKNAATLFGASSGPAKAVVVLPEGPKTADKGRLPASLPKGF